MQPNHDINRASSIKLLKLVLALNRKQLLDIPDAGHTDDILLLLRLANGDSDLMSWAISVTSASENDIHASCIGFIERVCFNKDTDPFGVLGLNPWADAEAIKEHYRLLIRIFHPDRGQVSNATAEAFSARINQAYSLLKLTLGNSDSNLARRASVIQTDHFGIISRRFTRSANSKNAGSYYLRLVSRLTPAKVLCATALLACLFIYLSLPQKIRMQQKVQDITINSQSIAPDLSYTLMTNTTVAKVEPLPDMLDNDPNVKVVAQVESKKIVVPKPLAVVVKSAETENTLSLKQPFVKNASTAAINDKKALVADIRADAKSFEAKLNETRVNETKAIEVEALETKPAKKATAALVLDALPSNLIQNPAELKFEKKINQHVTDGVKLAEVTELQVQPRTLALAPGGELSDRELYNVITSFMNSYANGDIHAFMQIFDEQVRSDEAGGRPGLQSAYAELFAKTASRSIVLKDLRWKKQGSVSIANADYLAKITRLGKVQANSSFGEIQIEVIKTGGSARISGFFYKNTINNYD